MLYEALMASVKELWFGLVLALHLLEHPNTPSPELRYQRRDTLIHYKNIGPKFEREYISHVVNDHEEDIDTFKEQAEDGKDSSLKQFAFQSVPKLEQHLAMAKQIEEKLESRK